MTKPKPMHLTRDQLRAMLHYDPATGVFTWQVKASRNTVIGSVAGCSTNTAGYVMIRVDKVLYGAHRLAWFYMTGEWPDQQIDHKDTNRANNRWSNLRLATSGQNRQNQRGPGRRNTSGYLGVHYDRSKCKWTAQIVVDRRHHFLGRFATPEEAHAAYVNAKRRLHPFGTL